MKSDLNAQCKHLLLYLEMGPLNCEVRPPRLQELEYESILVTQPGYQLLTDEVLLTPAHLLEPYNYQSL
jgi:hypothetical protein